MHVEVLLSGCDDGRRAGIGLPSGMDAVEGSFEDVPKDVESYTDSAGNTYAFGFGLNYSGPITD